MVGIPAFECISDLMAPDQHHPTVPFLAGEMKHKMVELQSSANVGEAALLTAGKQWADAKQQKQGAVQGPQHAWKVGVMCFYAAYAASYAACVGETTIVLSCGRRRGWCSCGCK